jgi:serine/threonine protein kinase
MTLALETRPACTDSALRRAARAERLKDGWRHGEAPDAAAALANDPDLAADRPLALEVAYEEFCTRIEAGETIDAEAFCSRFPFAASLRRLVELHHFLEEHPHVLDAVPSDWPVPGDVLGDFLLVRRLGRGGFARVYLALETTTGNRPVVLKVSSEGGFEAETLGPLSHPHLMPVLSSPTVGKWRIVAMPFLGAATLEEVISAAWNVGRPVQRTGQTILEAAGSVTHLDDPPFSSTPAYALNPGMTYELGIQSIAASLFSALAFLHARGIAHRDVKPSNVLLAPTGHPYLLDFNLATNPQDYWREVGTLPYMAPEQLRLVVDRDAARPADWRCCDIFSCGVLLYELLAGRHPFGDPRGCGGGPEEQRAYARAFEQAQHEGPAPLAELNPHVSRELAKAIERCLSRDPGVRPSAEELATLLSQQPPTPMPPSRQLRRRAGPVLLAACVPLLGLGVYLARPAVQEHQTPGPQPQEASTPTAAAAVKDPFSAANQLLEQGNFTVAASEFLRIGREHGDGKAFALAAYSLSMNKDHLGAMTAAEEAIRHGFESAAVYANRAYNLLQKKQTLLAKADCDAALRLDPHLTAAHFTRAMVHLKIAQDHANSAPPHEAIEDIALVVESGASNFNLWHCAATLYTLACAESSDPLLQEKAAACIRNAILCGKDPSTYSAVPLYATRLHGNRTYQEALTLTPGTSGKPDNLYLVNPIAAR